MQKQIRILIFIIGGTLLFNGFKSSRIHPKTHGIYTQNLTTEKEIWEHITRGTANYYATLHFIHGEFYVCSQMIDNPSHHFPTFRNAYLYPLFAQFKKNNHEIFSGYSNEITLFINTNCSDSKTCNTLKRQLYPYREMLTYRTKGKMHTGKIRIILTNKLLETQMKNDAECFFWLQGDLNDLNENSPNIPVICTKLNDITSWSGSGNLSSEDYKMIKDLVVKTHSLGKKIRIEDIPNDPQIKKSLLKAGVDYFDTSIPRHKDQLVLKQTY